MRVTASRLRQDIYRILDQVLETGIAVEIERHGKVLRIVPPAETSRTAGLRPRDYLKTDPEDLVHLDWSDEWVP
ncbi:MAG TPA: type II toxin-antitoxin system Phd/YefM family antitoxin [Thermoanaerobaculia bacterium]|nr:type II toxin-antitoxin system Phd/YefM family antitoxin [Thermoanaerobaculia bacterium]